jgi:hypothetical protein
LSIVALDSALALDPNQPLSYIATHFTVRDANSIGCRKTFYSLFDKTIDQLPEELNCYGL